METDNAWPVARFGIDTDGMAEMNRIGNLAEDLRLLAHAQHMAMMAQTDAGKRLLELFVEQEKQRITACWLPVSGAWQGGMKMPHTAVNAN